MAGPRTLDDLLALLPGLRRRRSLDADMLRLLLDRGHGECTWCGGLVIGRGRKWCGPACVDAFKLRCDPSRQRNFVVVRDAGVCRLCGRDTVAAEAEAERVGLGTYLMRGREESDYEFEARRRLHDAKLLALGYARGCWREVDHREPVVDGGGLCDPSSLRLLCGACHLRVTVESGRHRRLGGVA